MPKLAGLILAAGSSSRLGQPKQSLRYRGETLLDRAVALMRDVVEFEPVVVLGAEPNLSASARVVNNDQWQQGMGASIRCGIANIDAAADGVLIMPVDQYRLTAVCLASLSERWRASPEDTVVAGYSGTKGIPVIFPRRRFQALRHAPDAGAKALLSSDDAVVVPLPNAATDLDTPEDLRQFTETA